MDLVELTRTSTLQFLIIESFPSVLFFFVFLILLHISCHNCAELVSRPIQHKHFNKDLVVLALHT